MPSPPRQNEREQEFISRCISYLIKNEGKSKDQAAGQCYGMWRQAHGESNSPKSGSKK